jgi:hypothetical protein
MGGRFHFRVCSAKQGPRTGAVSSAVERLVYTENAGGSIPSPPTIALMLNPILSDPREKPREFTYVVRMNADI